MKTIFAPFVGASALMHIHHRKYSKHSSNGHDAMLGRIEEHVSAKAASVTTDQAYEKAAKHMNDYQRSQLQMMLNSKASSNATLAAIKTLNELFLQIEKQLTARTIECMDKYDYWQGQVDSHEDSKNALQTLAGQKTSAAMNGQNEIQIAQNDLSNLEDQMELELSAKQKIIDEETAILKEREAEMNEYAAIISFVDIACNSSSSKGFLQYSRSGDKAQCGTCLPGQTTEEAVNLLLSRPEFQTKLANLESDVASGVKHEMSAMGVRAGKDDSEDDDQNFLDKTESDTVAPTFENREEGNDEDADQEGDEESMNEVQEHSDGNSDDEEHQSEDQDDNEEPSSFIQVSAPADEPKTDPGAPIADHPSGLYKYCDGSCQGETPCSYLETLFGEELACRQRAFEVQSRIVNGLQAEYAADQTKHSERIEVQEKMITSLQEVLGQLNADIDEAHSMKQSELEIITELKGEQSEDLAMCESELKELSEQKFCGIQKLREVGANIAIKEHKAPLKDCDYSTNLEPQGLCTLDEKPMECIKGHHLPTKKSNIPTMAYVREYVNKGNDNEWSLSCPDKTFQRPCAMRLCAIDCKQTRYSQWSECSAECGEGEMTATRVTQRKAQYGGKPCGALKTSASCAAQPCNVDCKYERPTSRGDCSADCGWVAGFRTTDRKPILDSVRGEGRKCEAYGHSIRTNIRRDWSCPRKWCWHDAKCVEATDMVLAYECTDAMGWAGCHVMSTFAADLLDRLSPTFAGGAAVRVSVVKFGNGYQKLVNGEEDQYFTSDSMELTTLSTDYAAAKKAIWDDYNGKKWKYGYSNLGRAVVMGKNILMEKNRGEKQAAKKIIALTTAKRAECTTILQTTKTMDESIKVKLVSMRLGKNNRIERETTWGGVTWPNPDWGMPHRNRYWQMNFMNWEYVWDMHSTWLSSPWNRRRYIKTWILPMMCTKTHSKRRSRYVVRWRRSELLHMGRSCPSWNKLVAGRRGARLSLRMCSFWVKRMKMKSFVWVKSKFHWWRGRCMVDPVLSKLEPIVGGKPNDATCKCRSIECTGEPTGVKVDSWMAQKPIVDRSQTYGHYAVMSGWGTIDQTNDKLYGGAEAIYKKAKPLMVD